MNWDQLKTILWLRWRLTNNQWARSRGMGAVISAIIAVGSILMGATAFSVALVVGIFGLQKADATLIWGIWFAMTAAFLFFWMIGLITELQRSETIDLQRLMHLPVRLGQIFVINYLASHLALSIVLAVPAMLGLTLGLAISRGAVMLCLAPLALAMIFMITAWTYCLRGWLASLMSNPRKRRTVTVSIMFAFILLSQGPNLYFNVIRQGNRVSTGANSAGNKSERSSSQKEILTELQAAQNYIPPLWLPLGAQGLLEGHLLPALYGTLGCLAIGGLGLRRAYQATLCSYRGDTGAKITVQAPRSEKPTAALAQGEAGRRFLELQITGVPEQAAAVAFATFRSWWRAPEVKLAWGTSFVVTIILAATFLFRSVPTVAEAAKPFLATGAAVFSVFMLVQFYTNLFGLDRDGFRALVLAPVERRYILLGKNLACLPVGAFFGATLIVLISVRMHLSALTLISSLFQLAALLMMAWLVGDTFSILTPYRVQSGSLKPTKLPAQAMIVLMLSNLFFPVAMAPVFVPPLAEFLWQSAGWSKMVPINLMLSIGLAVILSAAYWQLLTPLGQMLRRRETKILSIVSVQVE